MIVAYLVGTYPAVSHTFVMREVEGLRALGVEVKTFAVHPTPPKQLLTETDRRAAAETRTIQPPRIGSLVRAHASAVRRDPRRYWTTLVLSQQLSPGGLRERVWHAFYFAEAIIFWRLCRDREISHAHVHFAVASSMIALLAAHYAEPDGGSWSFTMHGPTEFDEVSRFRLAEKVRRARFVACISDYARSQLMKLVEEEHWGKLHIVHCGVDPARFQPVPHEPRERLRVLSIGRLVPDKGQSLLIEAIAELQRRGLQVELDLVGDGPARGRLEALARRVGVEENVTFSGAVGQDRIRDHFRAADVFCLSSFAEGVPVSLMEAMSMGLPVVTPRVMGIPELVDDGKSGLLVPPGRVDQLAEALATLAADHELRAAMGRTGREKILAEFDIADVARTLRDVLSLNLGHGAQGRTCRCRIL
jgi:colanic acid/amylovoran biosynthesis glycosyltransferase